MAPTSNPGAWGTFANLKIQIIFMVIRTYAAKGLTLNKLQRKKCSVEFKKEKHWCLSTSKRAQRSLFSGERSVCDPPLNPDIHSLQAISCFVNYVPPGHLFSSSYTAWVYIADTLSPGSSLPDTKGCEHPQEMWETVTKSLYLMTWRWGLDGDEE